jgi:hypothetical protein
LFLLAFLFIFPFSIYANNNLAERLSGKILLEVESHGEAWYVNPNDFKRYYLGRPQDAFDLMKKLGLGAKHNVITGYKIYPANLLGKILIDTEDLGKAYYINPADKKAYYLGRPYDAFQIMKNFGLGITNKNLNKIPISYLQLQNNNQNNNTNNSNGDDIIYSAADAIRKKDKFSASSYFVPEMKNKVQYAVENMSSESLLLLGNILSGSKLSSSTETEKIYTNEVYFSLGGYDVEVKFHVKKQADGRWLIANL